MCHMNLGDGENAVLKSWFLRIEIIQQKKSENTPERRKSMGDKKIHGVHKK